MIVAILNIIVNGASNTFYCALLKFFPFLTLFGQNKKRNKKHHSSLNSVTCSTLNPDKSVFQIQLNSLLSCFMIDYQILNYTSLFIFFSQLTASWLGQNKDNCQKIHSKHIQNGTGSPETPVQTRSNKKKKKNSLISLSLLLYSVEEK